MPAVRRDGIDIHYEIAGRGARTILLQHGFTDAGSAWYENGWVERLGARFRLVLVDARGHGQSGKPRDPRAYAMGERVADLVEVLDVEGVERACYAGYSMGGRIGFELAAAAPDRIAAAALGGAHPFAQSLAPLRQGVSGTLEAWIDRVEAASGGFLSPAGRARLAGNDVDALRACVADDRPDRGELLTGLRLPVLLFVGAADPLRPEVERAARSLVHGRLVIVPGLDHLGLGADLRAVLADVEAFFAREWPA